MCILVIKKSTSIFHVNLVESSYYLYTPDTVALASSQLSQVCSSPKSLFARITLSNHVTYCVCKKWIQNWRRFLTACVWWSCAASPTLDGRWQRAHIRGNEVQAGCWSVAVYPNLISILLYPSLSESPWSSPYSAPSSLILLDPSPSARSYSLNYIPQSWGMG